MPTKIEWTTKTWNPIVGCSKVSAGCQNCYAIKEAHRLAGNPNPKVSSVYAGLTDRRGDRTEWTGTVKLIPDRLEIPLKTRKPTTWFVNSMSDLFHESVTDEHLDQIFAVMAMTPQHTYQCLSKRPQRMLEYCSDRFRSRKILQAAQRLGTKGLIDPGMVIPIYPYSHVWLGVTAENQKTANERRESMKKLAEMGWFTWVSHEPALEQVDFSGWEFIRWLVMGGESGSKSRPYDLAWPRAVMPWCREHAIPFFHKQVGSKPKLQVHECHKPPCNWTDFGSTGKGNDPEEWPEDLRVREYPGIIAQS